MLKLIIPLHRQIFNDVKTKSLPHGSGKTDRSNTHRKEVGEGEREHQVDRRAKGEHLCQGRGSAALHGGVLPVTLQPRNGSKT